MSKITVKPGPRDEPWMRVISFQYDPKLVAQVKAVPGARYIPTTKEWIFPSECLGALGLQPEPQAMRTQFAIEGAYPFQNEGIWKAYFHRRHYINFDTGLGKTFSTIQALKLSGCERILIACPASVRGVWQDEFRKWWPEAASEVGVVSEGRVRKTRSKKKSAELDAAYTAKIQIVSYSLLDQLDPLPGGYGGLVLDEAHRLVHSRSGAAKQVRRIRDLSPGAMIIPLSATPIANEPFNAWNILDIMFPNRYGKFSDKDVPFAFKQRYMIAEECEYAMSGLKHHGLNSEFEQEFRDRVAAVSTRVTKDEVAHLLPPFNITMQRVDDKEAAVKEWLEDRAQSESHTLVVTYFRKTLADYSELVDAEGVYVVDGSYTPEQRNNMLREAKAQSRATVMATMDSIGIGIDLTFTPCMLITEIPDEPELLIQMLGRNWRLNGKKPVFITILCSPNDESKAFKMHQKLQTIGKVLKPSQSEASLSNVLGEQSEDEFLRLLNAAAESLG